MRFVSVYYSATIGGKGNGGWDTHGDNFNQLKNRLLPITDQSRADLDPGPAARGLLDETLVVWMGEFGRSPKVQNTKQFGRRRPRPLAVLLHGPDGRRRHHARCDPRLERPHRRLSGHCSGDARRHRRDDVLGAGDRPGHRGQDTLGRPLPIAAGKPLTGLWS